ncbi:prephenate dehydrogenase [Streptomyces sp. NPDC087420]|uniref:prephenate dehydrogenase n=1 Tax=Streptomyces sp. NPDC087420 TaxID=3365785 RepID=UPI003832F22A
MVRTMAVVGTGLIGTSVALAARLRGVTVFLSDRDPVAARTAAALGAGLAEEPVGPVDLAVLAVPPSMVGGVLARAQRRFLARSYTDVASVKSLPVRMVLSQAPDPARFVGGHPMAGRERSGPLAARADLFHGRPWVLTPSACTSDLALRFARELVELCGGVPVLTHGRDHDDAVALTSHVPHLVASLMAARLREGPDGMSRFAGQGVRDVTRIAGGDSRLWGDILQANAPAIVGVVRELHADLSRLVTAFELLAEADPEAAPGAVSVPVPGLGPGVDVAADVAGAAQAGAAAGARGGADRGLGTLLDLLDRGVEGVAELPANRADGAATGDGILVAVPGRAGALPELLRRVGEFGVIPEDTVVLAAGGDAAGGALEVRVPISPELVAPVLRILRDEGWAAEPAAPPECAAPAPAPIRRQAFHKVAARPAGS